MQEVDTSTDWTKTGLAERIMELQLRRWTPARAQEWYAGQAWPCGFNFLPSTAVNFVEMWDAETFDETTIERELGWARDAGFNTVRTNLPFILWRQSPRDLIDRASRFLEIAEAQGLKTVYCFFDDCGFSGDETTLGPQRDPISGVHNSRAVASPGRSVVMDRTMWPLLKDYVVDVLSEFLHDPRILFWDLYNEPGNKMVFDESGGNSFSDALVPASFELMVELFGWARDVGPVHPITVGGWRIPAPWEKVNDDSNVLYNNAIDQSAFALSDIITFHAYCGVTRMKQVLALLEKYDRPLMCTEWMARSAGSRIEELLPMFNEKRIGAWQWGLVRGRTQTHIPWPGLKQLLPDYDESSDEWFHDLFEADGAPHSQAEIDLILALSKRRA